MTTTTMSVDGVKAIVDVLEVPELTTLITKWHHDRNLVKGSTDKDQLAKLIQEVGELSDSLCKGESPIDDIGDCIVVLLNIAERHNLTLKDCMAHAYKDIMHRTGRMVDGVFVKSDDLEHTDSDGWIEWNGGKCPVPASIKVVIRTRCGTPFFTSHPRRADVFRWEHKGWDSDIVAYKVV